MYFSDVFGISNDILLEENVFDISLISDLPLFIDPFLIFDSRKPAYQALHQDVVRYVRFLRDEINSRDLTEGERQEWLHFPEIPNNWLGYSLGSNSGRGLRDRFANGASIGLKGPLSDFGKENYSRGSHIERLFLFSEGTGRDALSDFITNLCHEFLLKTTQDFTMRHVQPQHRREFNVRHVRFDYKSERWMNDRFVLPVFNNAYVLLSPIDLLTQSVPWINRPDLFARFGGMLKALGDTQLRANVNAFMQQKLAPPPNHPKDKEYRPKQKEVIEAQSLALQLYPELANVYVSEKEADGAEAVKQSRNRVVRADNLYRERVQRFIKTALEPTGFFGFEVTNFAKLLSTFGVALEQAGSVLFLGNDQHVDNLSSEDVKLICTLAWLGDGNTSRQLPTFCFVSDTKSVGSLDATKKKTAGLLIITTDSAKKSRIELDVENNASKGTVISSITGCEEVTRDMQSIFISYTHDDENWARWIGSVLISADYKVTVQYKDFLPGTNFVEQMDNAVKSTDRTIAVLSNAYLTSPMATAEWQAVFREDPVGRKRKLVPIRVKKCDPKGLLGSIVYADICGLTEESARAILLGALTAESRKGAAEMFSAFPGKATDTDAYRPFLQQFPKNFETQSGTAPDASERLKLASTLNTLPTDHVNLLVFALNPPDNEIPPINAPAKDRAAALLNWFSRRNISLSIIEDLIKQLPS